MTTIVKRRIRGRIGDSDRRYGFFAIDPKYQFRKEYREGKLHERMAADIISDLRYKIDNGLDQITAAAKTRAAAIANDKEAIKKDNNKEDGEEDEVENKKIRYLDYINFGLSGIMSCIYDIQGEGYNNRATEPDGLREAVSRAAAHSNIFDHFSREKDYWRDWDTKELRSKYSLRTHTYNELDANQLIKLAQELEKEGYTFSVSGESRYYPNRTLCITYEKIPGHPKHKISENSYFTWVIQFKDEQGPLGHFASDVVEDKHSFPKAASDFADIDNYLRDVNASMDCRDVLFESWPRYQQWLEGKEKKQD